MGLAVFADEHAGEFVLLRFDAAGDPQKDGATLVGRNRSHARLARLRGCNRALNVGGRRARRRADDLSGCGISNLINSAIGRSRPCAIY